MTPFSPDEMLEVARHVYPDKPWRTGSLYVLYEAPGTYDMDEVYFDPKLDGTDREQAQALKVIVAALDAHRYCMIAQYEINNRENKDILSASISAILSHIGVKHER